MDKRINVQLRGRLGNQMFEYAFARSLSLSLKLPISLIKGNEQIALSCFEALAEYEYIDQPVLTRLNYRGLGMYERVFPRNLSRAEQYKLEKKHSWWLCIFGIFQVRDGYVKPILPFLYGKNVYCKGFFQSHKFFSKHSDIIRKDFTFTKDIIERCQSLANEITNCNSVCVHIRLGDYLIQHERYMVTDKYYYQKAIEYLRNRLNNPVFYIFTDDIERAKEMYDLNDVLYIPSHYSGPESMYLGTLCKHHVMSNSSFSWWMQYLGKKDKQIVIAPKKWYADDTISEGIYQDHWVLL